MITDSQKSVKKYGNVRQVDLQSITPSPENFEIYNPSDETDEAFQILINSISHDGVRDSLIITEDRFILAGHRRHRAAAIANVQKVPAKKLKGVYRSKLTKSAYKKLLAEYNRTQRQKTCKERFRERLASSEVVTHQQVIAEKLEIEKVANRISTCGFIRRSPIGPDKKEFLDAALAIINERKPYWPISLRHVHYKLLDIKPLRNISTKTRYDNNKKSSDALSDLLTRARIEGYIPMYAICDETRPETIWDTHRGVDSYAKKLIDQFTARYYRDLMIDQPNHVEIVLEKLTLKKHVENVAMEYCTKWHRRPVACRCKN